MFTFAAFCHREIYDLVNDMLRFYRRQKLHNVQDVIVNLFRTTHFVSSNNYFRAKYKKMK